MKKDKNDIYRRLGHGLAAALTCSTRLHVTLLVYTGIALLLLTYVSAQVYTTVLTQDIAELKRSRQGCKETLNKLTSEYISTSSRARVTEYCESKLGMVQANNGIFERFGVEADANNPSLPVEFTQEFPQTNDLYRFSLLREGGKSSR
jgi:cell division protein FtsB